MATDSEITLNREESITIKDAEGHELICVSFDMDPGMHLVKIMVYDTDGQSLLDLGVNYLGTGYPQDRYFVNQVIRSTLPKRITRPPYPVIGESKEVPGRRAELNPADPMQETWCELVGEEEASE